MSFETTWRLVAAVLGAALVLAGCTPMQWVKDDATPEEQQQDVMACQQAAWQEARSRGWYYRPFGGLPYASGRRFFSGPFGPYGDPFGDPFMEEARLTRFCMQSKGYELVPREPGD